MIAIVDYGLGNIGAIRNIYKRLNLHCKFASHPDDFVGVQKIVLPGVGAFDEAMSRLHSAGLVDLLNELVLEKLTPILGVCVGMQIMGKGSDEGDLPGLGWIPARVRRFDESRIVGKPKLPHMGWNTIRSTRESSILDGLDYDKGFYFLHSYHFDCEVESDVLTHSYYGYRFASAVNRDNIFGFQFHPEKSHQNGVALLNNFASFTC